MDRVNSVTHEMQLTKCREILGHDDFIHVSETNVSGDTPLHERKNLKQAIESLKKGETLIVWKMDRLCRDMFIFGSIMKEIDKRGANILSALEPNYFDDNPQAKLMRNLSMVIAEHELGSIRMRVKSALAEKKRRGERTGYIPYGYHLDVSRECPHREKPIYLIGEPREQEVLCLMERLYYGNRYTYREVADHLNNEGIPNKRGSRWSHTSVYRTLKSKNRHAAAYLQG